MKTYEFEVEHDEEYRLSITLIRIKADSLDSAKNILMKAEKCPYSAVRSWRVVPTKKDIAKTKRMLRGI